MSATTEPFRYLQFEQREDKSVPTFGRPIENNGWIRCTSRRLPGKYYYFNVASRCKTWQPPVSSNVPAVAPTNTRTDEEFMEDVPIAVSESEAEDDEEEVDEGIDLNVSSSEMEEKYTPTIQQKKQRKRKKMLDDVLFKLYHYCCETENFNEDEMIVVPSTADKKASGAGRKKKPSVKCEKMIKEEEQEESLESLEDEEMTIFPEICYSSSSESNDSSSDDSSSSSDSESSGYGPETSIKIEPTSENSAEEEEKEWGIGKNIVKIENDLFGSIDSLEDSSVEDGKLMNRWRPSGLSIASSSEADVGSMRMGSSSSSEENNEKRMEDDEEESEDESDNPVDVKTFTLPKLKTIDFGDLVSSKRQKKMIKKKNRRKRKSVKSVKIEEEPMELMEPKNKISKFIYEMNGIKTINWDEPEPEMLPGVKLSQLSDSGSSGVWDTWYTLFERQDAEDPVKFGDRKVKRHFDPREKVIRSEEPILSDSSSSSSSSGTRKSGKGNSSSSSDSSDSDSSGSSMTLNSPPREFEHYRVAALTVGSPKKPCLESDEAFQTRRKILMRLSRNRGKCENRVKSKVTTSGESSSESDETSSSKSEKSWLRNCSEDTD